MNGQDQENTIPLHDGHVENGYCPGCEMAAFTQKAMANGINHVQFAHMLTHEASLLLQYTIEHSVFNKMEMPANSSKSIN